MGDSQYFALKALAKKAVVERGQLAHVKDEKLLLQNMHHPLILELFSTFQVLCVDICFKTLHVGVTSVLRGESENGSGGTPDVSLCGRDAIASLCVGGRHYSTKPACGNTKRTPPTPLPRGGNLEHPLSRSSRLFKGYSSTHLLFWNAA